VKLAVAAQASREWLYRERTIALQHLYELPVWICFANEVGVRHDTAFEELAIACQENPPVLGGKPRERVVVRAGGTDSIESHEAKTSSELSKMTIQRESNRRRRARPNPSHL